MLPLLPLIPCALVLPLSPWGPTVPVDPGGPGSPVFQVTNYMCRHLNLKG